MVIFWREKIGKQYKIFDRNKLVANCSEDCVTFRYEASKTEGYCMNAAPINSTNAIDSVVFAVLFNRPFTKKEENKLLALRDSLKNDLPIFSQDMRLETKIENDTIVQQSTKKAGIKLQKIEPNGKIGWMLHITDHQIVISCQAYDRWDRVWEQTEKYLQSVIRLLDLGSLTVRACMLQYVDRFIQKSTDDYSVYDVFDKKNPYLTAKSVSAGKLWHVHQGWFDNKLASEKVLNILNLGTEEGDGKTITTIDHSLHLQFLSKLKPAKKFFDAKKEYKKSFDFLHEENKEVIKSLINQEQRKALMGLK